MYLSDAFELVCLEGPDAVAAKPPSVGLRHAAAGLKPWSVLIAEQSAGVQPDHDLLIVSPPWLERIHQIHIPDHLMESLESCEWDCVFLDYDLGSLEQDVDPGDHGRLLLNADALPSRPAMLLMHKSRARRVFECLPDSRDCSGADWESLMQWMGFFSIDMRNCGKSFLLWPPLRVGGGAQA